MNQQQAFEKWDALYQKMRIMPVNSLDVVTGEMKRNGLRAAIQQQCEQLYNAHKLWAYRKE